VCTVFERVLGLNWDESHELYLVSDALHQFLAMTNPTVTFQFGTTVISNNPTSLSGLQEFNMSYSSFDLSASAPLVSTTKPTRYFPLKRIPSASTNPPWVLGRAFLQDTYLTARYDQNTFSLSQARFDNSIGSRIQTLDIPGDVRPASNYSDARKNDLKTKMIIIFVCVTCGMIALVVCGSYYCVWAYRNGKRPFNAGHGGPKSKSSSEDAITPHRMEMGVLSEKSMGELSSREIYEAGDNSRSGELAESPINLQELMGDLVQIHEMDAVTSVSRKCTSSLRRLSVAS
jgi:hypothetical protein